MPSHDAIFGYARQIISPNQLIKGLIIVAIISNLELQSKHLITLTKNDFYKVTSHDRIYALTIQF